MNTNNKLLGTARCLPAAFGCIAASACAFGGELISTEQLQDAVRVQIRSLDSMEIVLHATHHAELGTATPPAGAPGDDHFVYELSHRALKHGKKYRLVTETIDAAIEHQIGDVAIATWDLAEARTQYIKGPNNNQRGREGLRIDIDFVDRPMWAHFSEPYLSLLGWCVLQDPECFTFADWVAVDGVLGPELMSDGRTRWVCPVPDAMGLTDIVILAERLNGRIQVVEASRLNYLANNEGKRSDFIVASQTVRFGQLRNFNGAILPEWATSDIIQHNSVYGDGGEDAWGHDSVRVIAVNRARVVHDTFRVAITDKQTVIDNRYRIAYTHGERHVNLDGRALLVAEPLRGDVGQHLEYWVRIGELGPVGENGAATPPPTHLDPPRSDSWIPADSMPD